MLSECLSDVTEKKETEFIWIKMTAATPVSVPPDVAPTIILPATVSTVRPVTPIRVATLRPPIQDPVMVPATTTTFTVTEPEVRDRCPPTHDMLIRSGIENHKTSSVFHAPNANLSDMTLMDPEEHEKCSLCNSHLLPKCGNGDMAATTLHALPCKHVFHQSCYRSRCRGKSSCSSECPTCGKASSDHGHIVDIPGGCAKKSACQAVRSVRSDPVPACY